MRYNLDNLRWFYVRSTKKISFYKFLINDDKTAVKNLSNGKVFAVSNKEVDYACLDVMGLDIEDVLLPNTQIIDFKKIDKNILKSAMAPAYRRYVEIESDGKCFVDEENINELSYMVKNYCHRFNDKVAKAIKEDIGRE